MAASQTCEFMIEMAVTIFNSVIRINPPFSAAYAVSVGFYQTIMGLNKTS